VRANVGTLELRTGRLREAEAQLQDALARERALAGDSAAVAAAMGYYGRVLSIRNRNDEAVPVLREAAELATRYAGATSPVALQNRLFLGDAQLAAGDVSGATTTLSAARAAAVTQYGEGHPMSLRARLAIARLDAATGHEAEAQESAVAAIAALREFGAQAQTSLAEALSILGSAQVAQGQPRSAVPSLQEAVALRERGGSQSWELAEARERLGEALQASGSAAASSAALRQAAEMLEAELGADHPETVRAKKALLHSRA
jgi:eukaryotic-like serine/threonine-protein kinase